MSEASSESFVPQSRHESGDTSPVSATRSFYNSPFSSASSTPASETRSLRNSSSSASSSYSDLNFRSRPHANRRNIEDIFDESVHPELREKLSILEQLRMEVALADRTEKRIVYKKCFLGSEAVDALVSIVSGRSGGVPISRAEAIKVGNELLTANLILHVTRDHIFKDGPLLYRFIEDAMDLEHGDGNKAGGMWQAVVEDLLSSDEDDFDAVRAHAWLGLRQSMQMQISQLAQVHFFDC